MQTGTVPFQAPESRHEMTALPIMWEESGQLKLSVVPTVVPDPRRTVTLTLAVTLEEYDGQRTARERERERERERREGNTHSKKFWGLKQLQ